MKTTFKLLVLCAALATMAPAMAQIPRQDAIWARTAFDPITLDGVLNEPEWAQAETHVIEYAVDAGMPGSGWKTESGWQPIDPTHATIRFLVQGNQLYMAATVLDQSIGGSSEFNRFDGLLMGMKNHAEPGFPKPQNEYMYTWWHEELPDPQAVGTMPGFIGVWAELPHGSPRTPEQIAAWDAVTVVDGVTNDDSVPDVGYTIEMRFDLEVMGYDVTQPGGDIVEWNVSVYDCDWFWPISVSSFSTNRVWWQGPWGNTSWYSEVRIFASPEVTTASGPVPTLEPEVVIADLGPDPTIDGRLDEDVWDSPYIYSFDIRWDDAALLESYDGVGPYRSGQFQPTVNGNEALVVDPADATVKIFHRGDMLYMGFEARDRVVQYHPDLNRWDGFMVTAEDRVERSPDNSLFVKRLSFQVDADGNALPQDDLLTLVTAGDAEAAVWLLAGTTVDTLGNQADNGYTAELAIDLKALGYPAGLGDAALFFGVLYMDGDSFSPVTDSYGTRTWWFREFPGTCCPSWSHLAPGLSPVTDPFHPGGGYARLLRTSGPSSRPHISFSMPDPNKVSIELFDLRGMLVERRNLGEIGEGENSISLFGGRRPSAGMYLYRVRIMDPGTGAERGVLTGKTMLVK
jgi:hypothetical protein